MANHHKQWVERIFDCVARQYGEGSCSFFNYFGKQLAEQVPLAPNYHVLDIATGKGAVLFPLAEKIGPLGRVVGIDISKQMLEETSIAVQRRNIDWIDLIQMDAEQLDFPDNSFDVVFCGFARYGVRKFFKLLWKWLTSKCQDHRRNQGVFARHSRRMVAKFMGSWKPI